MADKYAVYQPTPDELPATVAHGFLKRNAGNTAWEEAAYGADVGAVGTANANGTANTPARSDHTHDLAEATLRAVAAELTADLAVNGQKITGVGAPAADGDAATKSYVDATVAGARDTKDSVRLATAAAPAAYTRVANVITFTVAASQSVDGVVTALNDRILLKNGAAGADNGLYYVSTKGTGAIAEVWTRTTDADTSAEVTSGLYVWSSEGAANADTGWLLTTDDPITLNTTALSFTQVSGLGQVTAGAGLTKTGNTVDVGAGSGITVNADDVACTWGTTGFATVNAGDVEGAGTAGTVARTDHQHPVATAAAVELTDATNAEGTSTSLARADHTHSHGNRGGGALHAAATTSVNGFMSAADKQRIDDLGAIFDGVVQTTDATVTNVATYTPANSKGVIVKAWVSGLKSDDTQVAGYELVAVFRKSAAGTLTQVGSTMVVALAEDNVAWDATLDASAGVVRVRVTGVAATTINWGCNGLVTIATA